MKIPDKVAGTLSSGLIYYWKNAVNWNVLT